MPACACRRPGGHTRRSTSGRRWTRPWGCATGPAAPRAWTVWQAGTRARFYEVDGAWHPAVTSVLEVVGKSAPLMRWAAANEGRIYDAALREVLARPSIPCHDELPAAVIEAVSEIKAAEKARDAATIGRAAHAAIEHDLRRQLGEDLGPAPVIPVPARWAYEAWRAWAKDVDLVPLAIERVVVDPVIGFGGTLDLYATVRGIPTVLDWKTGKTVYPEHLVQNVAYRHAAARNGMASAQGMVVRLPKYAEDPPEPEVVLVPDTVTIDHFRAALTLWRLMRTLEGRFVGGPGTAPGGAAG
jgi:hypothetical protein